MLIIHSKKRFLQAAICAFLALAAGTSLVTLIKNLKSNADAISADGQSVAVTDGGRIDYGSGDGHFTRDYRVQVDGQEYVAFCGEPSKTNVDGTRQADQMTDTGENNVIRYLIYLYTAGTPEAQSIMDDLYSWVGNGSLYAYVHATIGYIYAGDSKGLSAAEIANVQNVAEQLSDLIESRNITWLISRNYQLYGIKMREQEIEANTQNLFWIENNAQYGNLTVQKCDSDTRECTGQGGASLEGISFSVYNNAGGRIAYNNRVVATYNPDADDNSAALMETGTTDASGKVVFANLPVGDYIVKEVGTNSDYTLGGTQQNVTLTTNAVMVYFYNDVKRKDIKINKTDLELGTCDTFGEAKLAGSKFRLFNSTGSAIYYGGNTIGAGEMILEKTLGEDECSFTVSGLPYGTYIVREVEAGTGYRLSETPTPHFVRIGDSSSDITEITIENQVIRGNVELTKVNKQTGETMANIPFRITSKTTGESHIIVTNEDGVASTANIKNGHSYNTNGYDNMNLADITNLGYGVWFGKSATSDGVSDPVNAHGALPYDTYEIAELTCNANAHCIINESSKKTFEIRNDNEIVRLGTWENDCPEYSVETLAVDGEDWDKFIEAVADAKVQDEVIYCAKPGLEYTIKGVLMDKETGEPLKINGKQVEATKTVKPNKECEVADLLFELDASELLGHTVVAYEYLYSGDELVASHADIDDIYQSIYVVGVDTFAADKADGDKVLAASSDAEISDTVKYCLASGMKFTLRGIVMDKATKEPLMVGDETVEQTVTITPEENCGELEMVYSIDTTELNGAELVVFEEVYYHLDDDDADSELILTNYDFDNEAETVSVVPETPETGFSLAQKSKEPMVGTIIMLVFGGASLCGAYGWMRHLARRKVFGKK